MAQEDFTELSDGLDIHTVDRGVTMGITPPPGGGSFVFGFNSLSTAQGCVGYFLNQLDFAPMAKGGSISGVIQRGASGGPTGFSPFFFLGAQGPSVNDHGYLLGLSNDDPHRIILKKGGLHSGIPPAASQNVGILRTGSATYEPATYLHLRLEMIVNENGDVILETWQNDLDAQPLGTAPDWQPIPGMTSFVDDALGINSGTQPFTSGRTGFGFASSDVTRRAFFDHLEIAAQL